jgi:hypothetical protein
MSMINGAAPAVPEAPNTNETFDLPNTIFGHSPDIFTIPIMKMILSACGHNGFSRLRRMQLLDRIQVLEISRTDAERRTIEYLLNTGGAVSDGFQKFLHAYTDQSQITRLSIAAGIPSSQAQAYNFVPADDAVCPSLP